MTDVAYNKCSVWSRAAPASSISDVKVLHYVKALHGVLVDIIEVFLILLMQVVELWVDTEHSFPPYKRHALRVVIFCVCV